jgi:hypothetical protein
MPKPVTDVQPVPDTAFSARMARGHAARLGHELDARHVTADGQLWHRVNLCCGAAIPAKVKTWEEEVTPHGGHQSL